MAPRNKTSTFKALDFIEQFGNSLVPTRPYDSIVDFVTHKSFCGYEPFPRQLTLLKLIYLETENMTQYDIDVIEEWRTGFGGNNSVGVQVDIWERVDYLKKNGYRRFPHVQSVLGRRASKGWLGGILGAETIAYTVALDDWQRHYHIQPGKDSYLHAIATNFDQAKKNLFSDIRNTVRDCDWLQPYISISNEVKIHLQTASDKRREAAMRAKGLPIEEEIATIRAIALTSTSTSGRGSAVFCTFYDEFAHMIQGTGGPRAAEEVYEAYQPAMKQFKKDSLTYIPSSPFCLEPSTKVLKEDLTWVPVGSLCVGDNIIGFDEYAPGGKGKGRTWQPTQVTETSTFISPRYEILLESGKKVVSTANHAWLSRRSQFDYNWVETGNLKPGDKIKSIDTDVWESQDSYMAGYIAGIFDGEGHISKDGYTVAASQNIGPTLEKMKLGLTQLGFNFKEYHKESGRDCKDLRIIGGYGEMMRFLGSVRPERLRAKYASTMYGKRIYGRACKGVEHVVSITRVQDGPVVALGTSTSTLVAEGLLSHNSKIGKFYDLYAKGSVPTLEYLEKSGSYVVGRQYAKDLEEDPEATLLDLTANPEMLIVQLPSWGLYQDWQRSFSLTGIKKEEGVMEYDIPMRRLEISNPAKFKVEYNGQFAEVEDAYLDPVMVDSLFNPFKGQILKPVTHGSMEFKYHAHIDPGLSNANFALAIGHLEDAEPDERGEVFPHVIIDMLKVWKAKDYAPLEVGAKPTIPFDDIFEEISDIIGEFPSMEMFTSDQWQSAYFLAALKKRYSNRTRIKEVTFTEKENKERYDYFKSALNLGWVHSFKDKYFGEGESLLEQELKFLTEKNGKVEKQEFGPVQTKDLSDCHQFGTDVLTENGWKSFPEVSMNEKVATVNENGEFEFQYPIGRVDKKYSGKMILVERSGVSFSVTPGHRMLVSKFADMSNTFFVRADALLSEDYYVSTAPKIASYESEDFIDLSPSVHSPLENTKTILPGQCNCGCGDLVRTTRMKRGKQVPVSTSRMFIKGHQGIQSLWTEDQIQYLKQNYSSMPMDQLISVCGKSNWVIYDKAAKLGLSRGQIGDRVADRPAYLPVTKTVDFARFIGFWLGDGRKVNFKNMGHEIYVSQVKESGKIFIRGMFESAGWEWFERPGPQAQIGEVEFVIKYAGLREYLRDLQTQGSHELRLPKESFNWNIEAKRALLDGLRASDGSASVSLHSTSRRLIDETQALMITMGIPSTIRKTHSAESPIIIRGMETKANYDCWELREHSFVTPKVHTHHVVEADYVGSVHCLTVPNGTLITRFNGKTLVAGNCVTEITSRMLKKALDHWRSAQMGGVSLNASPASRTRVVDNASRMGGFGNAREALSTFSRGDRYSTYTAGPSRGRFGR